MYNGWQMSLCVTYYVTGYSVWQDFMGEQYLYIILYNMVHVCYYMWQWTAHVCLGLEAIESLNKQCLDL